MAMKVKNCNNYSDGQEWVSDIYSSLFLFVSRIYKEYVNALNIKTK